MARKRASMREGPLAELFRATEAAQRAQGDQPEPPREEAETTSPEPEAPTQLPLEPEQPTAAEPFVAPETRGPIEFEATVEHVYDFEIGRERAAEKAAEAAVEPEAPVVEIPAAAPRAVEPVAEVVEVPTAREAPAEPPVVAPVPEPERVRSRTRHPRAGSSRPCRTARRDSTSPATSRRTLP